MPKTIDELIDELAAEKQRTSMFEDCLERARKLWQAAHPLAQFWPDGAENLAWVFDKLSSLEKVYLTAIQNNTQLQFMAYNQGLADGPARSWKFITEDPETLPEDGQQVIVLYDNSCAEDLIDMAFYRSGAGAHWWHTQTHAFSRVHDLIKAWMPVPGVPYGVDGAGEGEGKSHA